MGETEYMGTEGVWEISILPFDFSVTLKPLYKNYLLKNQEIKYIYKIKMPIFYDGEKVQKKNLNGILNKVLHFQI